MMRNSSNNMFFFLLVTTVIMVVGISVTQALEIPGGIRTCNDCYCVVAEGDGSCPSTTPPDLSGLTPDVANKFASMTWTNPITLDCDPFTDTTCTLTGIENTDGGGTVCAIQYEYPDGADAKTTCPTSYSTKTFPSEADITDGYILTHVNGKFFK